MKDVLRTVPLSPFAPIRSVIAKKMQENEEKNIKIVAGSKKSRTFATAIEKQRLQRKKVPWMSGLVSGLQNRVRRFESARNLQKQERIRMKISNPFVFQLFTSSVVEGLEEEFWLSGNIWLVSFKISYLCLPLFYETRTTPSCHPSGCAYRQL